MSLAEIYLSNEDFNKANIITLWTMHSAYASNESQTEKL